MLLLYTQNAQSNTRWKVAFRFWKRVQGPIFSKVFLKCRWLLEHENLSKVNKYIG